MSRSTMRVASLLAPLALAAMGCGDDEQVAPAEGAGGAGTTGTSVAAVTVSQASSSGVGSSGSGPVLRTILERNPFGSQTDNLLADGDFELSFGFAGQQGWTAYTDQGQTSLVAETGGLCHGGLRCARVAAGIDLFARGTAAPDGAPMQATIWVKPTETTDCTGVTAFAILCDSFTQKEKLIRSPDADQDGWCSYSVRVQGAQVAMCLYASNSSGQEMLFDDASLVVAPSNTGVQPLRPAAPEPVSAEMRARMDRVRDHVRDTLPLGTPARLPPGAKGLPGRSYPEPLDIGP